MPGLSSLIRPRPRWRARVSNRTPFSPDQFDNTVSSHPYASSEIIDIQDDATFGSIVESSTAAVAERPKIPSPQIKLDLNLTSEPFDSDWFQTQFTGASPAPSQRKLELKAEGTKAVSSDGQNFGLSERWEPRGVPTEVPSYDYDETEFSTSEENVLDHLKAMDASTFLKLPSERDRAMDEPTPSSARKHPPSPIRIPSLAMHGPQVQIIRSAEHNQSRPISEVSSPESSAVSGQTLARALLGNSFVLSADTRSSRYRSGFGGLVRSDSATLPRGDHPLLNSPYWRDRTLSGTSDTFAVDGNNVPPIPSNADKVYVPPQTPRQSGVEVKKKSNIRRHSSAGSLASLTKIEPSDTRSRPSSVVDFGKEIDKDILATRRISRISEGPSSSSGPTTPAKHPTALPAAPDVFLVNAPREEHPLPPLPSESPSDSPTTSSNPKSPGVLSDTTSSIKELDNVLDYYSFSDTQEIAAERAFAPSFSPILEESSSQLSSPASKRLSQRPTPTGSRIMSPLTGTTNGRLVLSNVRRPSDGFAVSRSSNATLLPIGERRRSIQMPPPGSSTARHHTQTGGGTSSSGSTSGQRISLVPPPPLSKVVGGRLRSGSAPSPIKVDRDSRDLNAYKITVSPLHDNALRTPSTGDSDGVGVQQTFPETPSAFSPFWSPGSNSPGMVHGLPEGFEVMPMPQTPMSATLPSHGRTVPPSIEQQMLTRAATMVRTRHSRQGSLSRHKNASKALPKAPAPSTSSTSTAAGPEKSSQDQEGPADETEETPKPDPKPPTHERTLSQDSAVSSASQYSEPSVDPHILQEGMFATSPSQLYTVNETGQPDSPSRASSVHSSPRLGYLRDDDALSFSPSITPLPPSHSSSPRPLPSQVEFIDPFNTHADSSPHSIHRAPAVSPHSQPLQTPPVVITPPAGDAGSPYLHHSLRRISEMSHNFESPPPYDTIAQDRPPPPPALTPGSGGSNVEPHFSAASAQPSPPAHLDSSSEYLPLSRKTSGRRHRVRPVAPTGPRRPSSHYNIGRARNPSISSVTDVTASTPSANTNPITPNTSSKRLSIHPGTPIPRPEPSSSPSTGTVTVVSGNSIATSPKSPRFHTPSVRYRGLTMDQAKWTFTSAQLQTVVSRAIRQSAEASSIRLLRLETLDNDIPQELDRLEAQKTEIKAKYRALTRASDSLFTKLNHQITSQSSSSVQRTSEELRDVAKQLNKLTEELHSVDHQQAQIQNLVQIHSASALSMALRKLNASFLKQLAQTQELQKQVADLEDEIWTINELRSTKLSPESHRDHAGHQQGQGQGQGQGQAGTNEHASGWAPELERKRSTHSSIMSRKPSLRFSRAMRTPGSRLSQRSSLSSGARSSMIFGAPGTNSTYAVPPVPPLPRRRPTDIITDVPTRSATMISTDGGTPNTEIRAMIRAQDELYQALGMSLRGDGRLRRSHSVIGLPGNPEIQPHPSTTNTNLLHPSAATSRPGSLESHLNSNRASVYPRPVSYPSSLLDAYNPMDADRNAMLATLHMLSQDD